MFLSLSSLEQQMEFNHTRSEQEHARQQATTDKPVAAVMDESRLKNAPHPRHPRTLTTNTPVDVQQLDPSYKQSHRPQKSDLNTVLHEQMQHESERRAEEREKVYGNAPLVPDMRGRSRLPVRVSYSDDDGKKIASEERVMDHVRTITREHVPLSDRLGHEKGEPIHYRPFTDEEKRKTELQKERKKLLEEMHQERTSLEARLKQEEHAMEDMERASYPLYKGHKHTGPIRFSAAFTVSCS